MKNIDFEKKDNILSLKILSTALEMHLNNANKTNNTRKRKIQELQAENDKLKFEKTKYENLKVIKIYNFLRKKSALVKLRRFPRNVKTTFIRTIKSLKQRCRQKKGISVIIPTHKNNVYLEQAVNSVLNQNYPKDLLEIIIVVNGKNIEYYNSLKDVYKNKKNIKVYYTEISGVNNGRKVGVEKACFPYLCFLDDDDFYTENYLKNMEESIIDPNVSIVIGPLVDFENDCHFNKNTYINNVLVSEKEGRCKDLLKISSLFSNLCGKLFNTKVFREQFLIGNENVLHSEDIIFWCRNFENILGDVYISNHNLDEAYVRRVRQDSLSRPNQDNAYKFFISDRLQILSMITKMMALPNHTLKYKMFLAKIIQAQTYLMLKYFENLSDDVQEKARIEINSFGCPVLNKTKFSKKNAIAFCYNFSPFIDASAFVATKRLNQISKFENEYFKWTVINQNMENIRDKDEIFHNLYSTFQFDKKITLTGKAAFNQKGQCLYALKAFAKAKDIKADVIYSRSQAPGSHLAAWFYKLENPNVKWYAEFSDPIVVGADNKVKEGRFQGDENWLNDLWWYIEQIVYMVADKIIFTNLNQMKFMLGYNPYKERNIMIEAKSLILHHPMMPDFYKDIIYSDYTLKDDKINIGYFGTFYANRTVDDMLMLLQNEDVELHIFTPKHENFINLFSEYGDRLHFNSTISNLEFLNLASRMDYLFLNDAQFAGPINPYLPSKYADYKSTGTKIITKIDKGSTLAEMDDEQLLKVESIDTEFSLKLKKQRK